MMTQPTNLGAITERVLTREGCMELALHQIIMKCDGSEMQTRRIRNIRERAKAGLEGRDPSSPDELAHVPPNRLLMAQLELSGKETDAARAERDALAAELKALREREPIGYISPKTSHWLAAHKDSSSSYGVIRIHCSETDSQAVPLYAHPVPARELTKEVTERIAREHGTGGWQTLSSMKLFAHAVERWLKGEGE